METIKDMNEVHQQTDLLDRASMVPIKIDDNGVIKDIDEYKGTYNNSQGKLCAFVAPGYTLVQHKQYFDSFAEALFRMNLPFGMHVSQNRNVGYMDITFSNDTIKFDKLGEEFATGFRLINSYDKTRGVSIMPRYTRLACTNGMILSTFSEIISIKHNSLEIKQIEKVIETNLNKMINKHEYLQKWVSECIADSIEWSAVLKIMEKLMEVKKHRDEVLKLLNIDLIETIDLASGKILKNYVSKNETGSKLTRWQVYNALTQYATHGTQISPALEAFLQEKAQSVLITNFEKLQEIEVKVRT